MAETKTALQKIDHDEKQKVLSQMKGPGKTPATEWSGNRQSSRKIIQNNVSEDDLGSRENNGEDAINIYQRPIRTKEQTNRDEWYTRRNP